MDKEVIAWVLRKLPKEGVPEDVLIKREGFIAANRKRLSGFKHIGEIPKGCQLVQVEFKVQKESRFYSIVGDIIAAGNNSFQKKHELLSREFLSYIELNRHEDILFDGLCKIEDVPN